MANTPLVNHWWNVPLYVTARGLTTSLMPHPTGRSFQIDFDFVDHRARHRHRRRRPQRSMPLRAGPVADFYAEVMARSTSSGCRTADLADAGRDRRRHPVRPTTTQHARLRPGRGRSGSGWRSCRWTGCSRGSAAGSSARSARCTCSGARSTSPSTRFSGRTAPPHPGGAPNCGPHVMREAYSHEVSSCGYWPGPPTARASSTPTPTPSPPATATRRASPRSALVRRRARRVRAALHRRAHRARPRRGAARVPAVSTYEAAADTADWDRPAPRALSRAQRHDRAVIDPPISGVFARRWPERWKYR